MSFDPVEARRLSEDLKWSELTDPNKGRPVKQPISLLSRQDGFRFLCPVLRWPLCDWTEAAAAIAVAPSKPSPHL